MSIQSRFSASYRRSLRPAALTALALAISSVVQAGPSIEFGEQGSLQLNYALQVWAQNESYTSATNDADSNDIFLRRNRITLSGQYNDYVGFYGQLEAGGDGKDGDVDKDVFFRDAYITLDYNDEVRFIVGRFKNTFSRENLEACLEPLTLDRGDSSYTPFAGTRDTGVALWGNLADARLQYRVALGDGRETENAPKDSPRVTARLHWSLLDPEYDYGYRGTYLGTRKVVTLGVAYDYQADVAYSNFGQLQDPEDYEAYTADLFVEYPFASGTYTFSAAYFNYSVGDAINKAPDPELPVNTEQEGFYVKAGYLLPEPVGAGRLQFYVRHDGADYNLPGGALDRQINGFGANYYIDGQSIKLTLDHQQFDYANPDPANNGLQERSLTTLGFQFIL